MLERKVKDTFLRQQYRLIGRHSAVKICHWTKESLKHNRVCYKELWYPPVQSHRCMEMTPFIGCNLHCSFCWRLHSGDRPGLTWKEFPLGREELDEPGLIIDEAIKARKKLLSGFKGRLGVDRGKFVEAVKPTMMTMSLTGEPTLYPMISELVSEAKKRRMITFLVTNGTLPEVIGEMTPLPFQLYVTVPASNKKTYLEITRPLIRGGWEKLMETLELLPSLNTRKVIRLTLVRDINLLDPEGYAKLILKAEPDFVEPKGFMWVGEARNRLPRECMPSHEEIKEFSEKLAELTGYDLKREFIPSRAVLLAKK